ncbi:oligosaccharide flippase family protein [Patescibacteria group bacterium]
MISILRKLKNDIVLKGTIYVTAGVLLASSSGYLLQLFLGRFLSIQDYGEINSLLALSSVLAIPTAALTNALIKVVSNLKSKNDFQVLTKLFVNIIAITIVGGGILMLIIVLFRSPLKNYLNISSSSVVLWFSVYTLFTVLSIGPSSFLRGLQRYKGFAFHITFGGFNRLLLVIVFVILGLRVNGVFFGYIIGAVASLIVAFLLLKKNFTKYKPINISKTYKFIFKTTISTAFLSSILILLNSTDMILVKHFFTPEDAGLYALVVTVGKIFVFGTSTIALVMFPFVSEAHAKKQNYSRKFYQLLFIQILVLLSAGIVFVFFSDLLVSIMFGKTFLVVTEFIPLYTLFSAFYVSINFLLMYLLAIDKSSFFMFLVPFAALQYYLISKFHGSIYEIIWDNVITSGALLFVIIAYMLVIQFKSKSIFSKT